MKYVATDQFITENLDESHHKKIILSYINYGSLYQSYWAISDNKRVNRGH